MRGKQSFARRCVTDFGRLISALALLVQLSAAAHAMPLSQASDAFEIALATTICHADPADSDSSQSPSRQPLQPCDLCPLCTVASQAQVLLTPPEFILVTPLLRAEMAVYVAIHQPSARLAVLRRPARDPPFPI